MIVVSHLTKTYGALKAVDDFSSTVGAGEIVGLIGPNGAGKTSTLRCIVMAIDMGIGSSTGGAGRRGSVGGGCRAASVVMVSDV